MGIYPIEYTPNTSQNIWQHLGRIKLQNKKQNRITFEFVDPKRTFEMKESAWKQSINSNRAF